MIAALVLLAQAASPAPVFDAPTIPDSVLADQRGGVRLPNGIDLVLTVQTQTAVDGAVVLQTAYSLVDGPPTISIYVPRAGETVVAPVPGANEGVAAPPSVTFDGRNGIQVSPGSGTVPVSIGGPAVPGGVPDGLEPVGSDGPTSTPNGVVTSSAEGALRTIALRGPDLEVLHLAGRAFGSAIANSGSDREINTATTISLDLRNAGPDVLGSSMLRVEDVALGALASRL